MLDRTTAAREFNVVLNGHQSAPCAPLPTHQAGPDHLQAARDLARLGWSLIPLCHPAHYGRHPAHNHAECKRPGKMPVCRWKERQTKALSNGDLLTWWNKNPGYNLGVVTGSLSKIVMVDIDSDTGEEEWQTLLNGEHAPTWEFGTGRGKGRHLVYRWTGKLPPTGNPFKGLAGHLDFLGEGRQSVVPPSLHVNGKRYEWLIGGPGSAVPLADAPRALVVKVGAGDGKNSRPGVCEGSAMAELVGRDRQMSRAFAYLLTMEPAIAGKGGHSALYRAACKLVGAFRLTDDDAVSLLVNVFNPRCEPAWETADIVRKVSEARRTHKEKPLPELPLPVKRTRTTGAAKSTSRVSSDNGVSPDVKQTNNTSDVSSYNNVSYKEKRSSNTSAISNKSADPQADPPGGSARREGGRNVRYDARVQGNQPGATEVEPRGCLASDLVEEELAWLLEPYIPRAMLSLVVGRPGSGKSTFAAHLMSLAKKVVFLANAEDNATRLFLPRLRANAVTLKNVLILQPSWGRLPSCKHRLIDEVTSHGADLVVADPIDSYLAEGATDNSYLEVRALLEALAELGQETGAAVVGVRHVGKAADNVCPGSRGWEAVPRSVVELVVDRGPPPRRIIRHYKDSLGLDAPTCYFDLIGAPGKPRVFTLTGNVDPGAVELAKEVPDRIDRLKIDEAKELLLRLLAEGEVEKQAVIKDGEALRLSDRTLQRAAEALRVVIRRDGKGRGHKTLWSLPGAGTAAGEGQGVQS